VGFVVDDYDESEAVLDVNIKACNPCLAVHVLLATEGIKGTMTMVHDALVDLWFTNDIEDIAILELAEQFNKLTKAMPSEFPQLNYTITP